MFEQDLPVPETEWDAWLGARPSRPAVFCLFGAGEQSLPYISKTANLKRRLHRLLAPTAAGGRRLHLDRTARLAYSEVGSPFAASLLLLRANRKYYGDRAGKRLHLRPPALLRFAAENPYPRAYVTQRVSLHALGSTYGPFPTRLEAERFLDDSLNLFLLRRCTQNLDPDPAFPGCVYSEMKMCLAPCFRGCTDERYRQEAERVHAYLASRGASEAAQLEKEREEHSRALDFEAAGRLHRQIEKVKAAAQRAAPLVHPIAQLDAIVVQPAPRAQETNCVAIFLVCGGKILGPRFYSVADMRHPNEHSGSTSLFPHPTRIEPVPLEETSAPRSPADSPDAPPAVDSSPEAPLAPVLAQTPKSAGRGQLEQRLIDILDGLELEARATALTAGEFGENLSLLARWYYRPRRTGEIFFRKDDALGERGSFPLPATLRGISRVFCAEHEPRSQEARA